MVHRTGPIDIVSKSRFIYNALTRFELQTRPECLLRSKRIAVAPVTQIKAGCGRSDARFPHFGHARCAIESNPNA